MGEWGRNKSRMWWTYVCVCASRNFFFVTRFVCVVTFPFTRQFSSVQIVGVARRTETCCAAPHVALIFFFRRVFKKGGPIHTSSSSSSSAPFVFPPFFSCVFLLLPAFFFLCLLLNPTAVPPAKANKYPHDVCYYHNEGWRTRILASAENFRRAVAVHFFSLSINLIAPV
ncbi:uncharacterized protein Tco025E_00019 [Trypanosoma conorhini]|uniref:Uncharacterized protein n=1 Tax=Trypanosoma conorhini TaxID=83891 RepID=A0A3R7NVA2_9TRYP|nr:uncharacterized protein Tco025E_00019 [Trypanosoma conorhini]RNF27635.1 hypothetical protein Tco025E_00019 [Trypanosoma conorhini]